MKITNIISQNVYLIDAAGGNTTAIAVVPTQLKRKECEYLGTQILAAVEQYGTEQVGFLDITTQHFEMAGGEFCGNATRAAATLIASLAYPTHDSVEFCLTVSGYNGTVNARVVKAETQNNYEVTCIFEALPTVITNVTDELVCASWLVDLGGIVHVLLDERFPSGDEEYNKRHDEITRALHLQQKDAVGVVWLTRREHSVRIDPVVWVRSVDTRYYETSCGSASIAVAACLGEGRIVQPSGKCIFVAIGKAVTLKSEMTIMKQLPLKVRPSL